MYLFTSYEKNSPQQTTSQLTPMFGSALHYFLRQRVHRLVPVVLPALQRLLPLGLRHRTVFDRILRQLLQHAQILPGRGDAQKGDEEIVTQRGGPPKGRIIRGHHHRVVIREEYRRGVISLVLDQFEHLVGDRVHFDADLPTFDFLQQVRMLDQGVTVADALGSQQDGVDLGGRRKELLGSMELVL